MNNKGMAISSILYTILVLFLALIFGILGLISSAKTTFDTLKEKLYADINDTSPQIFVSVDLNNTTQVNIKILSRKYLDSYYITENANVDSTTYDSSKVELETPTGTLTLIKPLEDIIYYLYMKDVHGDLYKYKVELNASKSGVYSFSYTGNIQTFTVPKTGKYRLEVWGAQGGSTSNYSGGNGGYAVGEVELEKDDILYVVVGGQGENCIGVSITCNGGYNGGGNAKTHSDSSGLNQAAGGGGATHIGTFNQTLKAHGNTTGLYIVAAGGGGAHSTNSSNCGSGGVGGGVEGGSPTRLGRDIYVYSDQRKAIPGNNYGPSCTVKNLYCSSFGAGGAPTSSGSGGGAGLYGGSGASIGPGAGGSSWIGGVEEGKTISGSKVMPDYNGTTMTGNSGDGYARIIYLPKTNTVATVTPIVHES